MLREACKNQYLALAGCSSSGKSDFLAVWGIINFLCAPSATMVLATSTSMGASKKRIWGAITKYWRMIGPLRETIAKETDAPTPAIKYIMPDGKKSDTEGLFLIPSEKSTSAETAGKMQGMKAKRLILLADELADLADVMLDTALDNLSSNPFFQMIGCANPHSYYDPFGRFAEPKAEGGYKTITVEDYRWETKHGICLHFDALKGPNYMTGENLYPFMQKYEDIQKKLDETGKNTVTFWKFFRGFWVSETGEATLFCEAEIKAYNAEDKPVWLSSPIGIGAADPAFTHGGDLPMAAFCKYGQLASGGYAISLDELVELKVDVTNKSETFNFQTARKFKEECIKRSITPDHAGGDVTGGGEPWMDIVWQMWSRKVLRVKFGGSASELPVSVVDPTPACDRYQNRVTEIWHNGVEFLHANQIRGLVPSIIKQMVLRKTGTKGQKIEIQSKTQYKIDNGFSPDEADAFFVGLVVARERLKATPGSFNVALQKPKKRWLHYLQKRDLVLVD